MMNSCDICGIGSKIFTSNQMTENNPSKFKTLSFAVLIIFGIGGLAVVGVGVGGLLHAGSLINLGQTNSILMIVIGGGGSIPLLMIGIVGFASVCCSTQIDTRNGNTVIPMQSGNVSKREEAMLETLTRSAEKEGEAFLIDFSKITPSNIFKIFGKNSFMSTFGDVAISDKISIDESDQFIYNYPFKYLISILQKEKNEFGFYNSSNYMFTMNDEGKVESYGMVFDNFDMYLEHRMQIGIYDSKAEQWTTFEYFDFRSVRTDDGQKILRKKNSSTDTN